MSNDEGLTFVKSEHKPRIKLYRYFSNIDYAIKAIKNQSVYFSKSDTFNDIFDCRFSNNGEVFDFNAQSSVKITIQFANTILLRCKEFFVDFYSSNNDLDKMEEEFIKKHPLESVIKLYDYLQFVHQYSCRKESFDDFLALLRKSYIAANPVVSIPMSVACFSEVNDSILMWSYYADKHQGVCLEYDLDLLDVNNPKHLELLKGLQKVQYSEYQYNNLKYFNKDGDINSIYFNKALCWTHEQEWRLVTINNIEKIEFPFLTGVYLGANFRQKYNSINPYDGKFIKLIRTITQSKENITLYEAIPDGNQYKINFMKILSPKDKW